jgi:Domain of unknown function (DUF4371)
LQQTQSGRDGGGIDIGLARKNYSLTANERLRLLTTEWVPSTGFVWPYSFRTNKGKTSKRYLGPQHFVREYDCFSFSAAKNGVFCKPCVMFAPDAVGGVKLDRLVKTPLQDYSRLTGADGFLTSHIQKSYHEDSAKLARQFVATMKLQKDVAQQVNSAAAAEIERNREALKRILLALEFHGRLGLPLRGHRDYGQLQVPSVELENKDVLETNASSIDYSQGNFRATLQLMLQCNDEVMRQHLCTAGKNSTYISPMSQNALIESIAVVIKRSIVESIQKARFYSILADETTDTSRKEQLTVCFRYILDCAIYERFFSFAVAHDLTGKGLSSQLLEIIHTAGLNKHDMVGQGYDGAAAMSGQHNGVQKFVSADCPSAVYVHCAAHSLNLCLSKAAEVPEIRAAVTIMHEIAIFYTDSNKRLVNLQENIDAKCPESNRTRLKKHCTTRWVEKQDAVHVFRELFPAIVSSLECISSWSGDSGNKAAIYARALDGSFLVAMEILNVVLEASYF